MTDRPEYSPEQVAEVVEGLTAITTEPAECWHPTHISRDDIRTILSALAKAEGDSKRLEFLEERAAPDAHISFETVATTEIDINGFSVEDDLFRLFFEPPREADNVPNYWGRSLREAIDLAMSKEGE